MNRYFKIMTWNVNSIKIRELNLLQCLLRHQPDAVCLQELKGEEFNFPFTQYENLGYHCTVFGQKAYNGVALLTKDKPLRILKGIPEFEDPNARYLQIQLPQCTLASIYAPNGESLQSAKFDYKKNWYSHLIRYLSTAIPKNRFIIAGDFNIAPDPNLDTTIPPEKQDRILCSSFEVNMFQKLLDLGLLDTSRYLYPSKELFTWWDYRSGSFPQNKGMRIEHVLASVELGPNLVDSFVDKEERSHERPSDHAPLIVSFKF